MKAWPLILLCFVLAIVIYMGDFSFTITKHVKFSGCRFGYKHIYLTSDRFYICYNNLEEYSARLKLIRCLCEKHSYHKDKVIEGYVMDFYNDNYELQQIYRREIVFKTDSNILFHNAEKIFWKKPEIMKTIRKYKDKDTSKLKLILFHSMDNNYDARSLYNDIIDKMPYTPPTIDSLVKYRDILFRYPSWGCGCS